MKKNLQFKVILLIITACLLYYSIYRSSSLSFNTDDKNENLVIYNIKLINSGSWNLTGTPIFIDGDATGVDAHNWTWAANQDWCLGSGTWDDPYIVENVTIDGQSSGSSIEVRNSNVYFIIRNSILFNSGSGTEDAGIKLFRSDNGQLINNSITANGQYGIYLDDCRNNTILDNYIEGNIGGIRVYISINNSVILNLLENNEEGIYLYGSDNNTIQSNKVFNNSNSGIYCFDSHFNVFIGNTLDDNDNGIWLNDSGNNLISKNIIKETLDQGIIIQGTYYNEVSQNIINNSLYGLRLIGCVYHLIIGNKISFCDDGIQSYSGFDNTFSENHLFNNTRGLWIGYDNTGSGHNLYKNYFIGNSIHALDGSSGSKWNNTIMGNYWDNYSGNDANNDGRGDTPYNVSGTAGSIDHLPIYGNPLIVPDKIHIDGTSISAPNWIWFITRAWGSGMGILEDPFIIQDLILDAKNNGDCIKIENSRAFFIIQNCTLLNFSYIPKAGINLYNTSNGQLNNNNITSKWEGRGIYLSSSNNTIIYNNTANNNFDGILLFNSMNNSIYGNVVNENLYRGIILAESNFNNISSNIAIDNNEGILFSSDCFYNSVYENKLENNYYSGFGSYYGDYNFIYGNQIKYNGHGIHFSRTSFDTVSENIISNNEYGIYGYEVKECNIIGNKLEQNDYGLYLIEVSPLMFENILISENLFSNSYYWGISINSDGNLIFLNNFTINPLHVIDEGSNNQWDNGVIGNYWDDYSGEDKNDDGIGDTPYNITGSINSIDNYPIWDDGDDLAPAIMINSPGVNETIGRTAPIFNVRIIDPNLDRMWYTIDGGIINITFTANSTINQELWESIWDLLADNDIITLEFYANDTFGHLGYNYVDLFKSIPVSDDGESIWGYNLILILGVLITISLITIKLVIKRDKNFKLSMS